MGESNTSEYISRDCSFRQWDSTGSNATRPFHSESSEMSQTMHEYVENILTRSLEVELRALTSEDSLKREVNDILQPIKDNLEYDISKGCISYTDVVTFSEFFVDNIIALAEAKCNLILNPELISEAQKQLGGDFADAEGFSQAVIRVVKGDLRLPERKSSVGFKREVCKCKDPTVWPTIKDFSPDLGRAKILQYINVCYFEEDWIPSCEILDKYSDSCSDFYKYELRLSIPTKCYPVPQATTSLFFTIEVSRIKPVDCTVDVTFMLEGFREIFRPQHVTINEKLLLNIMYSKINVFKKITF